MDIINTFINNTKEILLNAIEMAPVRRPPPPEPFYSLLPPIALWLDLILTTIIVYGFMKQQNETILFSGLIIIMKFAGWLTNNIFCKYEYSI